MHYRNILKAVTQQALNANWQFVIVNLWLHWTLSRICKQ